MTIWETLMSRDHGVQMLGNHHAKSQETLDFLISHRIEWLQFCRDCPLPFQNILTEHLGRESH